MQLLKKIVINKKILSFIIIGISLLLYLKIGSFLGVFLVCPIYHLLGLYCPGCGVTRMLLSLLKGNFYQAFRYNPLVFLSLPFFCWIFIDDIRSDVKNEKRVVEKLEPYIWYVIIGVFMIYGVLRNIPIFEFLRPLGE